MSSIKRSASTSPTPTPSSPSTPVTTPKKPKKANPSTGPKSPGSWTTFRRGEFLDDIIAAGARAADLDALAIKYGVKKSQLVDQLKPNRSNIRSKAIKRPSSSLPSPTPSPCGSPLQTPTPPSSTYSLLEHKPHPSPPKKPRPGVTSPKRNLKAVKTEAKSTSPIGVSIPGKANTGSINGTWTAEKRGSFMEEIIAAGYKVVNLDELAHKLQMNKRQLVDQLVPNRNNLRGKAVKAARGE
ncbi:hypothetical protein DB88DRAFT_516697 [Papiliotrema laurentii]|uniref:Uncharacterized protein n=1 Tax=Papiliotrema laurentii TaxID=5418 RepID=A0AAD9FX93_PAPLA|nr:hypothetical protein DB88DRAFT_516697 [Papiliotrema laurentii]